MINVIKVKTGACFALISPAGFRILSALETTARRLKLDLTITCGSDNHPPSDPHAVGSAYDVRTHDLTPEQKRTLLRELMLELAEADNLGDAPIPISGGLATTRFFGWIENLGQPAEHLHVQQRRGVNYP